MSQLLGNAFAAELDWKPKDETTTVRTGARYLDGIAAGTAVDVWGAEVGEIQGSSTDEIFVVLEGKAEVTFHRTGETIVIGPGDVVRLFAGHTNTWRTIETIRKVSFYVPPVASGS
ncbi:cupin domain-containing protein [Pseudonocardia xishanensis]|uniref:(S)-ureidoglycine aminohydrolase cupin domain-containing protein n=1 Tax=Pseudonocardia xishanensis TaxID=630995 RepID=A0ABP8S0S9_9PSEU